MKINITFEDVTNEELAQLTTVAKGGVVQTISTANDDEAPSTSDVTGQVDVDGQLWNEAVHSSSKAKNKDGRWKKRKGAPEVAAAPAPVVMAAPVMAPQFTAPVMPQVTAPAQMAAPVMVPQNFPAVPPAQFAAPAIMPQTQPVAVQQWDINALFAKIQGGIQAGKINAETITNMVTAVNQQLGLQASSIPDYTSRPDALAACANYLTQFGA